MPEKMDSNPNPTQSIGFTGTGIRNSDTTTRSAKLVRPRAIKIRAALNITRSVQHRHAAYDNAGITTRIAKVKYGHMDE